MHSSQFYIQYKRYNSIAWKFDDFHDVNICFISPISNKNGNGEFISCQKRFDLIYNTKRYLSTLNGKMKMVMAKKLTI